MAKEIRRLEQALGMWEDFCYLGALHSRLIAVTDYRRTWKRSAESVSGPEKHWREFRRYLLSFRGDDFDLERFVDLELWKEMGVGILARLPALLGAWTAHSRHVFHLTPDLQRLLELTSVSRLQWKDVACPYDAFAITLDQPIVGDDGIVFDCILVTRKIYTPNDPTNPPNLAFYVFSQGMDDRPRIDWRQRAKFDRMVALGKFREMRQEIEEYQIQFAPIMREGAKINFPYGEIGFDPEAQIVDVLDDVHQHKGSKTLVQALDIAIRIIVSLCAYLSTLPPKGGNIVSESDAPADPEIKGITKGADVCRVLSSHCLTSEERQVLGSTETTRQFRQLSPHWRRGHFRREPGQGHNPFAQRCVWVRPALVRKDLLRPGLQVGGAQVDVE